MIITSPNTNGALDQIGAKNPALRQAAITFIEKEPQIMAHIVTAAHLVLEGHIKGADTIRKEIEEGFAFCQPASHLFTHISTKAVVIDQSGCHHEIIEVSKGSSATICRCQRQSPPTPIYLSDGRQTCVHQMAYWLWFKAKMCSTVPAQEETPRALYYVDENGLVHADSVVFWSSSLTIYQVTQWEDGAIWRIPATKKEPAVYARIAVTLTTPAGDYDQFMLLGIEEIVVGPGRAWRTALSRLRKCGK